MSETCLNRIMCCDVFEGLKKIPDESVHLIFCSPPYNVGVSYGSHKDKMPYKKYLEWMQNVWMECKRVMVSGARLVINIDSITNIEDRENEYVRCMPAHLYNMMLDIGLKFRADICWYKQAAAGKPNASSIAWGSYMSCSSPAIRRNHEHVLVWCKDKWVLEGDSELSDMTKEEFEKYTLSTWFITPDTKSTGNHPATFPVELARRVIKLYTYRGNVVLDPFSGSGTTPYVANMLHRKYIGIDNDKKYCDYAKTRIQYYDDTNLFEEHYVKRSDRIEDNKKKKYTSQTESIDL